MHLQRVHFPASYVRLPECINSANLKQCILEGWRCLFKLVVHPFIQFDVPFSNGKKPHTNLPTWPFRHESWLRETFVIFWEIWAYGFSTWNMHFPTWCRNFVGTVGRNGRSDNIERSYQKLVTFWCCSKAHWASPPKSLDYILGGGFKNFLCSPQKLGKWSILTSIFFKWVGSTTN